LLIPSNCVFEICLCDKCKEVGILEASDVQTSHQF